MDNFQAMFGFDACHTFHVGYGILTGVRRFICFVIGAQAFAKDHRIKGNPHLREQFAAARAA